MAIQDDFSVGATGDIRYTGTVANYTVIAFHRWLGDLMDDILGITDATASERSTDNIITLLNGYNIDDATAQHLYDGSIIQAGGDVIYDGILIFAGAGAYVDVIQNGAAITPNFWTTGLNADAANGISHRFMVKVRSAAADIDGKKLIGQTREFGFTYSEFRINGTSRGNNVMALTYATDLNNQTAEATVATWNTITNTEGFRSLDVDNNTVAENYYSEWNRATFSINQFYQRMKWLTRRGSASTVYGLLGYLFRGITHEVTVTTPRAGNFNATENVSWGVGVTAGTGRMVAINSVGTATKMWIQLLTGVAPSASVTITGVTSTATCTNSGSPVERTLSFPFCGQSTGSSLIGAFGFGVEVLDLSSNDKVFDLTNTQRQAPNYVTFVVGGLVSGEDRVLVGPELAGGLNTAQFATVGLLNGAAVTSIVVNSAIPTDTPASGTIRVKRNSGIYSRIAYSSYSGSTFTIASTNFATDNATAGNDCYISYIDELAASTSAQFTSVYLANRSLFIRVRDGALTPIKTFETTGVLGVSGGSSTAIRTSDV